MEGKSRVHPLQQAFVDGFKAWDSEAMARALIAMLEAFGKPLREDTRQEIGWNCREMLDNIFGHPNVVGGLFVPEIPVHLLLVTGVVWTKQPGVSTHSHITLRIGPSAQELEDVKTRWHDLGFINDAILIERDKVRTPAPLKDEPGYQEYDPEQPSIHRPKGDLQAPSMQTYAYALSVEAGSDSVLLQRYRAGERKQVWDELTALGEGVRQPDVLPHAIAVARETMRRCRINVERLHARLIKEDYHFRELDEAFTPPEDDIIERIAHLEQRVGPLPLSLCAWYELVGAVNYMVDVKESSGYVEYSDPLVIYPAAYTLDYDEENWYRERYKLYLAPDFYHKDDISGGAAYCLYAPNAGMDAFFYNETHKTTFVNYLRIAFGHEGFPGDPQRGHAALSKPPDELLPI